ncbi:hypothetical protein [Nodosilinea sp. E11]|uniref:hypothetical protein n=1 Tax=Nodosilinea sp. E11 TaxID=3037479 RepID=UPI002934D572|nr:hypothetical protein [Nodosilinea sp. E11]WOD37353.1 hypothetical protein RRF56_02435 [Nodosilinea sp. E11]
MILAPQATAEVESLLADESFAAALQDFAASLPISSGIGQNQIDAAMPSLEPLFGDLSALPAGIDLRF